MIRKFKGYRTTAVFSAVLLMGLSAALTPVKDMIPHEWWPIILSATAFGGLVMRALTTSGIFKGE